MTKPTRGTERTVLVWWGEARQRFILQTRVRRAVLQWPSEKGRVRGVLLLPAGTNVLYL